MTARAAVHTILTTDAASAAPGSLGDLGVQHVYAANAVDTPAEACFVVIRWGDTQRSFGTRGPGLVTVWAHDTDRDYGRITDVLARVRALLTTAVHVAGADGWTLTAADWRSDGPDVFDPAYGTCCRWSEFTTASRQEP